MHPGSRLGIARLCSARLGIARLCTHMQEDVFVTPLPHDANAAKAANAIGAACPAHIHSASAAAATAASEHNLGRTAVAAPHAVPAPSVPYMVPVAWTTGSNRPSRALAVSHAELRTACHAMPVSNLGIRQSRVQAILPQCQGRNTPASYTPPMA